MSLRRLVSAVLSAAVAVSIAACSSAQPGWTFAPVPSTTPVPSPSAEASASAAASAEASASAPASGSPGTSGAPSAAPSAVTETATLEIVAQNIKWTESSYGAPADAPFRIVLDNQDSAVPHDVSIRDAQNEELFKSPTVTGPASQTFDVAPIPAGEYKIICTIHPTVMIADLTVTA